MGVRGSRVAGDVLLGAGCAVVLGFWASRIASSWGPGYAAAGLAAGTTVAVLALLRRRHPAALAIAGLAVAAASIALARLAGLPSEPGPGLALALSVLIAPAAATLPARTSCALAAAHGAVAFGTLFAAHVPGVPPVTVLNVAAWLAAVGYAAATRIVAHRHRAMIARIRRDERRRLAGELHDLVGYHLTHIVLHSQAAQLLAHRTAPGPPAPSGAVPLASFGVAPDAASGIAPPAPSGGAPPAPSEAVPLASGAEALAEIEVAGGAALGALRRVVGLLRDADGAERPGLSVRDPR